MDLNNIQINNNNLYDSILKLLNNLNLQNTAQVFSTEFLVLPNNNELIKNSIMEFINDFMPKDPDQSESPSNTLNNNDPVSPIQNQNVSNDIQILATQAEIDERIDKFITVKRAKIDQSNQEEFIDFSKSNQNTSNENNENPEPCSRTNPNKINRNIQMKIDIINNYHREISLLRSVGIGKASVVEKSSASSNDKKSKPQTLSEPSVLERLSSLEAHLNLKLENSSNKQLTALERIQVIELKMLQLERTDPTWCGLNFAQPNREFPPPPPPNYVYSNRNGDIIISQKSRST